MRQQGHHVNTLDILLLVSKEGDMVNLVLEQDASDLITNKLLGLDLVGGGVEVVRVKRATEEGQLQSGALVERLVVGGLGPHQQGIDVHGVFRGGFLVFAVARFVETVGP